MKFDYQQHVCTVVGSRIDASVLKISDGPVVVLDLYLRFEFKQSHCCCFGPSKGGGNQKMIPESSNKALIFSDLENTPM